MAPISPWTPWTAHSNASLTSLKSLKSTTSASISSIGSTLGARLNLNLTTAPGNETDFERLQRVARQEAVHQQKAEEKVQANRRGRGRCCRRGCIRRERVSRGGLCLGCLGI
ncbi:hypothetical protein GYMLUDRAFT_42469 [Collybiopsis luxurians FD-317 M1]|uniref:Uncharacterized protein n=1 Tax=Collybiopsis luxurians FD-317 M1 TaxID=944289 RepID=A0A0D0CZN1_9AGAR|nr:hypothetical protein GYMLUDRAFT_42469 [Collybiopsis luxurians FD-317 M1]